MSTTPYEIIAGPADVFVAPVGTEFPDIDAEPTGDWVSLGRTEGGITTSHDESVDLLYVDQASGPVKAIRTEEHMKVSFSIAELTLERYARVMNDAFVSDIAPGVGAAGHRSFPLRQGFDVARFAMLIRGPSPYMDAFMQFEIPIVVQSGSPAPAFVKDDKTILDTEWEALEDPDAATPEERFGSLRAQDAPPTPA
jgi:hypothetical protein